MNRISAIEKICDSSIMDYKNEYIKIIEMTTKIDMFQETYYSYTLEEFFNTIISEWKYRNTATSLQEIYNRLELPLRPNKRIVINKILVLIDLLLNIELFINYFLKKYNYLSNNNYSFHNIKMIDSKVFDNCRIILKNLNYSVFSDEGKIILIKNETDVVSTISEIKDNNISKLLLSYVDFRNEKDISNKKRILKDIADYLEPIRKKIPNVDLENTIFKLFNNINIRHNNKEGKYKNEIASRFTKNEQLEWYDRCFSLCLTAIRLIEFKNDKDIYDVIK